MVKAKIVQAPDQEEIPAEVIAQSIVQIAEGMRKLNSTRLTRKAIVVLLCSKCGVNQTMITRVLDSMGNLEKDWLKPKA